MQIALELEKSEASRLHELQETYSDEIVDVPMNSIDGAEWLTFTIDMTKALAPHIFAFLTVLVTTRKKVVVIHNGERKQLTKEQLEDLKKGSDANG